MQATQELSSFAERRITVAHSTDRTYPSRMTSIIPSMHLLKAHHTPLQANSWGLQRIPEPDVELIEKTPLKKPTGARTIAHQQLEIRIFSTGE